MAFISSPALDNPINTLVGQVMTVQSVQGETLDALLWRALGASATVPGVFEQTLGINPGLCDMGEVLPLFTSVLVPVNTSAATNRDVVQLWD